MVYIARRQQGSEEVDSAPGAPQERNQLDGNAYIAEVKELQRRWEVHRELQSFFQKAQWAMRTQLFSFIFFVL